MFPNFLERWRNSAMSVSACWLAVEPRSAISGLSA
jgi:hypothetical protein